MAAAACAAALVALAGCGAIDSPRLVDYLDELEFDVPLETASYVSLGEFDIPITAERYQAKGALPSKSSGSRLLHLDSAVRMRLQFELMAETAPPHEKAVKEGVERHRGALNDAVLTVVRTSTVEELADPRLAAVKARLTEITRPMLGDDRMRQLVFDELTANEVQHSKSKAGKHGDGHGKADGEKKEHQEAEADHGHDESPKAADEEKHGGHH